MLGGNPETPVGTNLLYTGEWFDTESQNYYLRARYYDPLNGRFNQIDPVAGSPQDPQSLHKYLYAHNNPVNGVDPSGTFFFSLVLLAVFVILGLPWVANAGGVCGPDVTQQLKDLERNVERTFDDLPSTDMKRKYCSSRMARDGWDIHEFKPKNFFGGWDVRELWPWGCATGICKDTVMVNGGCYSSHEVNYYLFGVMTNLCVGYEDTVNSLAKAYFYTQFFGLLKKNNPECKRKWIKAGFIGSFAVASECDNLCRHCARCSGSFKSLTAHWKDPWGTTHNIYSDFYSKRTKFGSL